MQRSFTTGMTPGERIVVLARRGAGGAGQAPAGRTGRAPHGGEQHHGYSRERAAACGFTRACAALRVPL
eukprot:102210-Prymnesium_polylepis.1